MKRLDLKIPEDAYQDLEQLAARYGVNAGVLARMLLVRAITEESGESPESIRKPSGHLPETVREISGNHPEDNRTISGYSPENIRTESGKSPETIRTSSGERPETVRKTSGSAPEQLAPSGQNPEDLRKTSGNHPENVRTPASPSSPPITPLSPPGVFSTAADAAVANASVRNCAAGVENSESARKRRSLPRELLDHPAVKAYRHILRLTPPRPAAEEIVRTVGDRIEAWEEVLRRWAARPDWNPRNIAGMLDRFRQQTEPEEPEPELEPDTRQLRVIDPEELDRQLREIIEKADSMVANRGDGS